MDEDVLEVETTATDMEFPKMNLTWTGNTTVTTSNTDSNYWSYPYTYWYGQTIYLYQIMCPKLRCKRMNWGELEKITVCTKCGSKLRAIKKETQADYEIPVD